MTDNRLPRRKARRKSTPEYPDCGAIAGDRRRFLKLLGGLVLGAAAGAAGRKALAGALDDDPKIAGNMKPVDPEPEAVLGGKVAEPAPPEPIPGGVPAQPEEPEPEEKKPTEEVPLPGEPPLPPEDVPVPGGPSLPPQEEYELDGDVAEPAEPTPPQKKR